MTHQKRLGLIPFVIAAAFGGSWPDSLLAAPPVRPNIIFVLADDLGYADLGCYGQTKIKTPCLDKMADEGIRFTQAYCGTSVCAPSRCILMIGLHAGHSYIRANRGGGGLESDLPLPAGTFTVARMLQQAGYRTACIGKWGLGGPKSVGAPNKQGFDYFFGYSNHGQAHEYYPDHLWRNDQRVELDGKTYSHDAIVDEAFKWVRENHTKPFFLYLPFTIPHANLQVPDLGIYANEKWSPPAKAIAAMTTRMDRDIGRLFALLKELGIDENTLVLFASDNGANRGGVRGFFNANGNLRGEKRDMYEGGLRVPIIARWPGHTPAGKVNDEPWAFWDFLPTCAELTGGEMPADVKTDGISIVPALIGGAMPRRDYFYWEIHEPISSQAVRFGDIKGVRPAWNAPVELYDLKTDPSEANNLAASHPELLKKAEALLKTAHVDSPLWPIVYVAPATAPSAGQARPASRPAASRPAGSGRPLRPVVGAIRWDAWHGDKGVPGQAVEKSLGPKRWHERLPFFAKVLSDDRVEVRGDTQAVMDQEISYASQGGLDYWAFCYYPKNRVMNYGLDLYLASEHKSDMHFCLLLQGGQLGPAQDWTQTVQGLVQFMKQPTYQKVLANRPLVYLFQSGDGSVERSFGSPEATREAFRDLRQSARSAGVGNPYLVFQDWSPAVAAQTARELGFDAISAYATTGNKKGEQPYSVLADHVREFWEQCRATGLRVVPLVMAGWDRRPRIENPVPWETKAGNHDSIDTALHFTPAKPEQLANSLSDAIQWNKANRPANPTGAILLYAWNETDEGGWLVPTLSEGAARLRAIGQVLNAHDDRSK